MRLRQVLFLLLQQLIVGSEMEEEAKLINQVLNCDRYIAEAKINEGSYGEIFRVRHKMTSNVFAIKAMELEKLHKMHKSHEAAIEEIILKKTKHPGIVKLQEVIYAPKYIGMVMELCPFGDFFKLMRVINKNIELTLKKRKILVFYLAQIIETVDYLHSNFIIHRDLKPQNIVLGADLNIRIIDFGTAKAISSEGFITEKDLEQIEQIRQKEDELNGDNLKPRERISFVGTVNYLSPEGIDLNYSAKNDIWAIGILAYKFYFNKLPYQGHDSIEIFKKIKLNNLPVEKEVEPQFEEFFRLTLDKDPERRSTAAELKKLKLFQDVDFKNIFYQTPPITKLELISQGNQSPTKKPGSFLFEMAVEKRMFFGNYKPRLLTIQRVGSRLLMAYRYIPSKKVKHDFELNMNDYAQVSKNNQFEIVTTDKRFAFKLVKHELTQKVVAEINAVIKSRYALE